MLSSLHKLRLSYEPKIPACLQDLSQVQFAPLLSSREPSSSIKSWFPQTFASPVRQLIHGKGESRRCKIGAVFSGGPASGGHNVIMGLFDSNAEVIGFLGGPSGLIENRWKAIDSIDGYRNQGGFDLLGTDRTKIETEAQFAACLKTAQTHSLDGLVIIGGDDSHTNAAFLAEYFLERGCKTCVVGAPKTIDGDLRSAEIEISFGFDTACKTYSELIGNIARDALSVKKYYHFIKLMGRSASHVTLECALATQPNLALIGEERRGIQDIVQQIADLIQERAEKGKAFGVILMPEGLIEFVPELSKWAEELHLEKDPHGNLQLSQIQTEKILIEQVKKELKERGHSEKLAIQEHFLGYEGRCALPTNFDADYAYSLGLLASLAVREKITGVTCAISSLGRPVSEWKMRLVPIIRLMRLEMRSGKEKPVVQKTLVDTNSKFFVEFLRKRKKWELEDSYQFPGPIQFFGSAEITESRPVTLGGNDVCGFSS